MKQQTQYSIVCDLFGRVTFLSIEDAASAAANHSRVRGTPLKLQASNEEARARLVEAIALRLY
jgi:hypothetical protein